MHVIEVAFFALISGVGPALVWLWFWLRQDTIHPEPRFYIIITFIAGMIAVPLVYPFQSATYSLFGSSLIALFLSWAALEEFFKLGAAYVTGLTSRAMDDPIDAIIYLVTAALGFAALENVLFLYGPLVDGNIEQILITSNLRFVGANLLHVVSSAAIGAGIALTYYLTRLWRIVFAAGGILTAIILHTAFNSLIINTGVEHMVIVFIFVWIGVSGLLFVCQRAKYIKQKHADSL